jgi:hypothetical protein
MTAIDFSRISRPAMPRGRILNVVRLQFVNRQTFIWIPLLVLGGAWVITMLIYWMISSAIGRPDEGIVVGGGQQAPLWYFMVVGVYAMTLTFPFSQAMSLTRREFFLGSLIAAAVSAVGMACVYVLLGLFEQATNGYGINGYFGYMSWLWEAGALSAGLTYFTAIMLAFIIGFWFATVYKRFGPMGLTITILAVALALLGFAALATWQQAWPDIWVWILDTGALGLTLWGILLSALLAVGSYFTLRKMPA